MSLNDGYSLINCRYLQPPLLTQRFMLNLRQLNPTTQASENNSEAQHFSRFSMSFRTPSDFLGNIGEPLDHDQVGQMEEGADNGSCEAENPRDRLEEGFTRQASSSFACRDEPAGAAAAPVLFTERASEEDNIGSSTFSREIVPGPSTAADYQVRVPLCVQPGRLDVCAFAGFSTQSYREHVAVRCYRLLGCLTLASMWTVTVISYRITLQFSYLPSIAISPPLPTIRQA